RIMPGVFPADRRFGILFSSLHREYASTRCRGKQAQWAMSCTSMGNNFPNQIWRALILAQIFHRSFNVLSKLSIFGGVFVLVLLGWAWAKFVRSDYVTGAGVVRDQPVPFSHQHHVGGLGIDCRYCHGSVETSAFAGMPTTKTCMNCHAQIWADSP